MSGRYRGIFGTDGVRGRVNTFPMTAEVALQLAMAAGRLFRRGPHQHRAIIGKDTRRSNYFIEQALTSGLASMGIDVYLLGPLQTSGVAMLTRTLRADLGIMITASHNPYDDNGIKLMAPDGRKLSDAQQREIEALMDETMTPHLAGPRQTGHVQRLDDGASRYIEFAKATFPRDLRLDGLRIVVDCANGAGYRTAPAVFWELGAEVRSIGVEPNGFNINEQCGSTAPEALREAVSDSRADIGIALDGDADRLHITDERGNGVDGDKILAVIAERLQGKGQLHGGAVVANELSNNALERHLQSKGLALIRTGVGDRNVIRAMDEHACNLGGEQSGHIILGDYIASGDGVIAALQVLAAMVRTGKKASELCHPYEAYPQIQKSIRCAQADSVLACDAVQEAMAAARRQLGDGARLVVRRSGTEQVIRVMAEGEDRAAIAPVLEEVSACIARTAAHLEHSPESGR